MPDAKGRPLRKIVSAVPWPIVHNGIACWYVYELLECGHIQPKRQSLLGPYKAKAQRRCDACANKQGR